MRKMSLFVFVALFGLATAGQAADRDRRLVVTASNAADNQLLVYDLQGAFLHAVPTLGHGGAGSNAGGVAANGDVVAVVNFGSNTVSVFQRDGDTFALRETVPTSSQPLSVAFGNDHLYVLGTTTVESHRASTDAIDAAADGLAALLAGDGSAAQVGVAGDALIVSEKSGPVEIVPLRAGSIAGPLRAVDLPEGASDTPFGLVTRGDNTYVTIAHSDAVALVRNGVVRAVANTGIPGGTGQHSPCWIAVAGPFLYTSNSPSRSISRLIAAGSTLVLDRPVAAQTSGAPIDVATADTLLVVIDNNGDGTSALRQFHITANGDLEPTATTAIPAAANGVAIVGSER